MIDCKNLIIEDITPWHGDVFDHPNYKYTCTLTGNEVIPYIHCNCQKCNNYEQKENQYENNL